MLHDPRRRRAKANEANEIASPPPMNAGQYANNLVASTLAAITFSTPNAANPTGSAQQRLAQIAPATPACNGAYSAARVLGLR